MPRHSFLVAIQPEACIARIPIPLASLTIPLVQVSTVEVHAIGSQWFSFIHCDSLAFKVEIAPARTFGIFEQIEQLRNAGFIKGGSLDNALVCSLEKGWLNPPLRFLNEPCRHKLLDLIGDLALCGQNGNPGVPVAHIVAFKASHALHSMFGKALLDSI
eukprot:c26858_g1_i2 orf=218-694(-)